MNLGNEFISASVKYLQITCDIIVVALGRGCYTEAGGGRGECLPMSPGAGVTDAAAVANLINCLACTRVVCVMRRSRLIYASYVSIFITSCKNETSPSPLPYSPLPDLLTLPPAKC